MTLYKGILLYNPIDTGKNEWFINHFIEEAATNNISLTLMLTTNFYSAIENEPLSLNLLTKVIGFEPDFVINRSRDFYLAGLFEELNIPVYNSSRVTEIANDKDRTYNYLSSFGIEHLPYITIPMDFIREDIKSILQTANSFGYPIVLKPAEGHGGAFVTLINSEEELIAAFSSILEELNSYESSGTVLPYNKILLQRCASDMGKDLRAYVLDGKIIACIMRSSDKDFRANFSLGGNSRLYIPSAEENQLIEKIIEALPSDLIGIDFVYHNGRPVLNEIEDAVGCRMLYANTDIDIIIEYISYITKKPQTPISQCLRL